VQDQDYFTFQSKAGLLVRVRPIVPEDAPHLVDLFEHLGPKSRYTRFQRVLDDPDPELVWREAEFLADIEAGTGAAWLAFADLPGAPCAPVASARYIHIPPDEAEVAIAVRDDLHSTGIGTTFLLYVADQARAAGIRRLLALVQNENLAVWSVLRHSPYPVSLVPQGNYTYLVTDLEAFTETHEVKNG
jgi:GNAT superfamily N-acetyltransferase